MEKHQTKIEDYRRGQDRKCHNCIFQDTIACKDCVRSSSHRIDCRCCSLVDQLQTDLAKTKEEVAVKNNLLEYGAQEMEKAHRRLKKWQIKSTEAICLTDLSCRHKKVFRND